MTAISFDRVGDCPKPARIRLEGYSAKDGLAHGSLDVTLHACEDCHQTFRTQLISCGMTAYSFPPKDDLGELCGYRCTFEPNKFSTAYEGSPLVRDTRGSADEAPETQDAEDEWETLPGVTDTYPSTSVDAEQAPETEDAEEHQVTNEAPRGARAHVIPLPEARRIKRAIESLGTGASVGRPAGAPSHPMGERGDAAQYLGMLKALVQQIEYGLNGGPLETDVQKGVFATYERDLPAILAAESARAASLREFTRQGIVQLPLASQQMAASAVAFMVAEHGLAAACEIAVGVGAPGFDENEVVRQSEAMYEAADQLTEYVAEKRAQFGGS